MKRVLIIVSICLMYYQNIFGQNTDLLWVSQLTGTGTSLPLESVIDASGNIYVVGQFNGTISQGAFSLNVVGGLDGYIAKYNKNGQIQWLKQISGAGNEQPSSIALSNDGNYIYISANCFSNPSSFDGNNVATLGSGDICIAKFAIDGTFQWAHNSAFGAGNQTFSKLTIDNSDNILLTGTYITDVTFYGEAVPHFSSASANFQTFISKFDNNGVFVWAIECPADNNSTYIRTVSVDATGYYFGGSWSGSLTLDVSVLNNAGNTDMFLYKTDYSGIGQWVRRIMGSGSDILTRHKGDALGYQYITGYYNSPTLTIDSTTALQSVQTISNAGSNDIFYSCYAPDGTLQYTKTFGTAGDDQGQTIFANSDHIILGGSYTGNIAFDSYNLTNDATDAYMVETDKNGNVLYADKAFGTLNDYTKSSGIDANSNNVFIGDFTSPTIDIGGNILTNASANRDMFLAKYGKITITKAITNTNCATSSDGAINLTITGNGTAPYTFVWTGPGAFAAATEDINGLATGWYYVTLTDANGARKSDSAFVDVMPALSAELDVHSALLICAADVNGEVTVITTDGVAPFTYDWGVDGVYLTPSRNDLDTGWHYVTVTDVCAIPIVDSIRVNYLPELNVNITLNTPASCPAGGDGYAFALATSGVPPYTYTWSGSASNTYEANDLGTGWQYVTVTDFCISQIDSVNISWNPVVTATSSLVSSVTCTGLNNGSATITASLGKAPYTYLWSTGEVTATATTLVEGWNYYTVTDACTSTKVDSINISVQSTLVSSVTLNAPASCPTSANGSATASVSAGIGPYTYLWDNTDATATSNNLTIGWHYVTITDGCGPKTDSVLVTNMPLASVSLSTTNILLICATDLGSATILTTDGVPPFTYDWGVEGIYASPTRNDLDTGWHYVTVTDVCNNPFTGSIRVNSLPEVTTLIVSSQVASCSGGGDGQATVQASSGVPPYSYAWSNSISTSATATDLQTGWQYVTVSDFCVSRTDSVYIDISPPLSTSITSSTPANCTGASNGSATVTASNGGSPYTYLWTSGENTAAATALSEGWNYVTVTDICTNSVVDSVNITVQSALQLSMSQTPTSCPASTNGAVSANVSSGVPPISYLWSTTDVTPTVSNLGIGWYYITVTDGCGPRIDSVEVTNMPLLQVSLSTQNILLTCATDLGSVTIQTQDGVTPFTYDWGVEGIYASPTRNNLDTGWHYVTVTDVCNMPYTDSVRVNHLPEVVASIVSSGLASCSAGGDGTASVQAISGVPPYSYLWSSGETTADATTLLTGWQYVTVSDYCVSHIDSVEIFSASPLSTSITSSTPVNCSGGSDGTATVTATNGGLPYSYLWTTGETNATATQLVVGWNWVTVTDACGSLVDSVLIDLSPPVSIAITSSSPTSCAGGNNGGATVTATNAVPPVTYIWSTGNANAFATDLIEGWNYVTVTDLCTSLVDSVQISSIPALSASITSSVPASCPVSSDGKANVTVSNGSAPFTYAWSNSSSTGSVALDLLPGWTWVTVTDICGSSVDSVNITNLPVLSINVSELGLVSCQGGNDGSGIVAYSNGKSPYTFTWSSTETNDTALVLVEGWNYVTVTDFCGSLIDSINIAVTPVVSSSYDRPAEIYCYGDTTARIVLEPLYGIAPYSYTWGDTPLTTVDRSNLGAGKYYFTVTDGCNSTYSDSIVINQPGAISLSTITTNVSFTGLSDGAIDLIVSGGTQPYNYVWSNTVILEDIPNIPVGTYYVTVTDNNGCIKIDSATIETDSWNIEIYKAFSPNGDGKNDVWNIKYISAYPLCEVSIFDEWGIKVFESVGYDVPWDGTSKNGNKLPAATYYYIIDLKEVGSQAFTGSVTLLK